MNKDGSRTLAGSDSASGGSIALRAAYVAEHVDLRYAVAAPRSSITMDASHVVVSSATTRESPYVSMLRGREAGQHRVRRAGPSR